MLPELAAGARVHGSGEEEGEGEEGALLVVGRSSMEIMDLPAPPPPSGTPNKTTQRLGQISSRGIAIGFGAGVTALTASLIPVLLSSGSLRALQGVIGASGVVWALLTGVMWRWLGPTTATGERELVRRKVGEGWARVVGLFDGDEVRRLKVTYWYLLASALLQDGTSLPPPEATSFSP